MPGGGYPHSGSERKPADDTQDMAKEKCRDRRVGINVDEEGRMCGDVDFESLAEKAAFITPVPGGVGGVTTSILAAHVLRGGEVFKWDFKRIKCLSLDIALVLQK